MVAIVVDNGIENTRKLLFAENAFVSYGSFYTQAKFAGLWGFIFIKQ
jgi:hypothetical protein